MKARVPAPVMRFGARQLGRRCLNPALPWPTQRTRLNQLTGLGPLPRGTQIAPGEFGGVTCEVVTSGPVVTDVTVVHFHGGGYCVGSPRTPRAWAAALSAEAGCRVVLPVYRLAPEHPYPAALADARSVLSALFITAGPSSVLVSGDSAGGGLALALTMSLRDSGAAMPAGCILLSAWLDLGRDWAADTVLARRDVLLTPGWLAACANAYGDPADPLVSPLRADLGALPPLLIQAGTDELLVPDSDLLATRASAALVDVTYTRWPRMWHDFALQPGQLAAADSAVAQAAWFVGKVTS